MVIELMIFHGETTQTHHKSGYGKIDCDAYCEKLCAPLGSGFEACYAGCLLTCRHPPKSVPDVVRRCTSTCIQSTCSKYFHSGNTLLRYIRYINIYARKYLLSFEWSFVADVNTLEQCIAKECIGKCALGAQN